MGLNTTGRSPPGGSGQARMVLSAESVPVFWRSNSFCCALGGGVAGVAGVAAAAAGFFDFVAPDFAGSGAPSAGPPEARL